MGCTGVDKPQVKTMTCNRIDCPPRYYAEPWGQCSVSCGNGTRTRTIVCVILMADGSMREVSSTSCSGEKVVPIMHETCLLDACPRWMTGKWRKCSKKCTGNGTGLTTRTIQCVAHNGSNVHKSECKYEPKPEKRQNCGNHPRVLGCYYEGRQNQSAGNLCSSTNRPMVS